MANSEPTQGSLVSDHMPYIRKPYNCRINFGVVHNLESHPKPITWLTLEISVFQYEVSSSEASRGMFDIFGEIQSGGGFPKPSQVHRCLFGSIYHSLFSTICKSTQWWVSGKLAQVTPRNNPCLVRKHALVPCRIISLGIALWRDRFVGLAVTTIWEYLTSTILLSSYTLTPGI